MLKRIHFRFISIYKLLLFCLVFSCSGGGSDDDPTVILPPEVIPSNIALNVDIVGSDASNPNGNGSGMINVNISATDAVKYAVKFGNDNIIENSSGTFSKTVTQSGTNNYLIGVFAYSSTNYSISTFESVTVYVFDDGQPQLIWSDEFNTDGAPNTSKWSYDIGDGGWGNGESQYYTDRPENVIIEDGLLKIIPKKENFMGSEYTSARIKTEGKFDFKYGSIEIRAKLPSNQGTWPALWMLGSNFQSVGWPSCGEIDIMEQTGSDKSTLLATCHWLNTSDLSNASYGLTTNISNASTAFHIYTLEWTETYIKIFVDDVEYYELALNSDLPFNNDFFLIMNVAMGGTLGGTIDSEFSEDTMEIDYVRVYQ